MDLGKTQPKSTALVAIATALISAARLAYKFGSQPSSRRLGTKEQDRQCDQG